MATKKIKTAQNTKRRTKTPRPKQSPTQKAYKQQINRINRAIKRLESRGYIVDRKIVPKQLTRPNKRSIEKAKSITTKDLYKHSMYYDRATDTVLPGTEGRKIERSRAAQKSAQTRKQNQAPPYDRGRIIADKVLQALNAPVSRKRNPQTVEESLRAVQMLMNIALERIEIMGKSEWGLSLEQYSDEISYHLSIIQYDSDWYAVRSSRTSLGYYFTQGGLSNDEMKQLTEYEELERGFDYGYED